jgi:hypothetical protein
MYTKTGYSDLKNLGRALEKHNKSKDHIASACKFVLFGKQKHCHRNRHRSENGNRKV